MTRRALVLVLAVGFVTPLAAAAGPPQAAALDPAKDPADAQMKAMVDALKANAFAAFVAEGTARHKGLSRAAFDQLSARFAPLLMKGYKTTFLAKLRKPGGAVTLWELEPAGAAEDYEIRLVTKDGKVDSLSIL